eukprot:5490882-Alexandrium_andersonii.AAC.1
MSSGRVSEQKALRSGGWTDGAGDAGAEKIGVRGSPASAAMEALAQRSASVGRAVVAAAVLQLAAGAMLPAAAAVAAAAATAAGAA